MQYKKLIATFILICTFALSNNIYIYGTYDLNQNGNIEYFKLNKDNNTIKHQLLRGFSFIQTKGIIHRDIKPDNIMIDYLLKITISAL